MARKARDRAERAGAGLRVLVHSLSHALMRAVALEAGYSQASIRERIYCREPWEHGPMAGVLLATAAPDSERSAASSPSASRTRSSSS